jgi:2-polyprenyl-3-methyl-5-hydroxy-6-metoxy-1,4-benzoquinol methylase
MHSLERLKKESPNGNRRFRYEWAKKFIRPTDTVLDVGCGSAYGREMLAPACAKYLSVDYTPEAEPDYVADFNGWNPDFEFDVFVGFESIEHMKDTAHYVEIAKKAKTDIFITCPASETISWNPHHVFDFSVPDILRLFEDKDWRVDEHFLRIVKKGKLVQQLWKFTRRSI